MIDIVIRRVLGAACCTVRWLGVAGVVLSLAVWASTIWGELRVVSPGRWTFRAQQAAVVGFALHFPERFVLWDGPPPRIAPDPTPHPEWIARMPASTDAMWRRAFWMPSFTQNGDDWSIILPLWTLAAGSIAISAPAWLMRCRRVDPGKCSTCSYALTGLASESPCPECGTPRGSSDEINHLAGWSRAQ